MPLIPKEIYALVERKRRSRWVAEKRAMLQLQQAQAAAFKASAPPMDKPAVKNGPGDRTGKAALAIVAAEEKLEQARAWETVWRKMDRWYPFDSSMEGRVAGYLYDNGMSVKDVGTACGCSRDVVNRARDKWVYLAALSAAGEGLITIREAENNV